MIWRARILSFMIVMFAVGGARAETWSTYHNTRFGTTAQYPAGWKMGPEPENNDGREFTSPDKQANIVISGIFFVLSRAEEFSTRLAPDQGETITYQKQGPDLVVVSGTKADRIFYRKSILACKIWNDLSIEYPAADKTKYAAIVDHVAASLKAGHGYDYVPCK